jgi:hypothetical protein
VLAHFTLESANSCLPRPDFTNTEPAAQIGPFPQWGDPDKIVAMDPYGHLAPWVFKDIIEQDNGKIRLWKCKRVCIHTYRIASGYQANHSHHQSPYEGLRFVV